MELTDSFKALLSETAETLRGSARRHFMARTVQELGPGGQRRAERELGWCRGTIRKGLHEVSSGFTCADAYHARGRKRAEAHLPHLLEDITAIVDSQSQADPQFRTTRLYTRLSTADACNGRVPSLSPVYSSAVTWPSNQASLTCTIPDG